MTASVREYNKKGNFLTIGYRSFLKYKSLIVIITMSIQVDFDLKEILNQINQKLDNLDSKFEQKLDNLDSKFEQKLDNLDKKFEQKLDKIDDRS